MAFVSESYTPLIPLRAIALLAVLLIELFASDPLYRWGALILFATGVAVAMVLRRTRKSDSL